LPHVRPGLWLPQLQPWPEIIRRRGGEMEFFSGDGMIECELPGVEKESRGGEFVFFPVDRIAENGRTKVVHVDADLMGAAGVEVAEDEGGFRGGIGGERLVIGDRGFAAGWVNDGHFLAVHGVAADVGEDGALVRFRYAVGYGEIEFFHGGSLGKLGGEGLVGGVRFRDDKAAGGVLVEAVDDAGALDPADAGELAFAMVQQGVDESAVGVAGRGVDDDAVFLMEDEDVFVFVEDIQRNVLRCGDVRDGLGEGEGDGVAGFHGVAWFCRLAVKEDVLLADQCLDSGAREIREFGGEIGIEPVVVD